MNIDSLTMLPELKFNTKMMQALIDGRKKATRRKDPKDICEGLYVAAVCPDTSDRLMLKCTKKYSQRISDMTVEDSEKEGFVSIEDFKKEISDIYGNEYLQSDPSMWVYEFVVVGRPAVGKCTI